MRTGRETGRLDDLELAVLRENEKVAGGKERQAAEEHGRDVNLDGRSAAHEAEVVEFDESLAEEVVRRRASGGEADGGEGRPVNVEIGERARMDFDGVLLPQSAGVVHRDAAGGVSGH